MLFVTIVTREVKNPGFHFFKKEYSFIYATVHFDLFFSNSAWYKNTLNTPGVLLSFSQNKNIKIARSKGIQILYKEWFSQLVSHYIAIDTLGIRSQNNWEIRPLHGQEIKPWRRVVHFKESVLIVTFNGNSIGKWNRWKFNVHDFSSIFTILPNGYNVNEALLKESQKKKKKKWQAYGKW